MTGEYSLADIAAATGNGSSNEGWGENGSWWIILFLIFAIFGWGGNGRGFAGGGSSGAADNYVLASDFATIQRQLSDGFNSIDNALDRQNAGICDLGYTNLSLNNQTNMNMMQGFNAVQTQLADCCCRTQQNIKDTQYAIATTGAGIQSQIQNCCCDIEKQNMQTNYNLATQNCATLQAIDKVGDRIIDYLAQDKAQALRDENQALRLAASQSAQNSYLVSQLRPSPIPAYNVPNPYCCNAYANYSNGCGCGGIA